MKKLLVLVAFLTTTGVAFPQNGQNNLTDIENFISQPDRYITYDFTDIGEVKNIKVQVINASDNTDNKKVNGLLISYENSTGFRMKGYLDDNEIKSLIKAMEDLKANFKKEPASVDENTYYSGHSAFRIGGIAISVSGKLTWNEYISFGGMEKDKKINLTADDFDGLLKLIVEGKSRIGGN